MLSTSNGFLVYICMYGYLGIKIYSLAFTLQMSLSSSLSLTLSLSLMGCLCAALSGFFFILFKMYVCVTLHLFYMFASWVCVCACVCLFYKKNLFLKSITNELFVVNAWIVFIWIFNLTTYCCCCCCCYCRCYHFIRSFFIFISIWFYYGFSRFFPCFLFFFFVF